MKFFFYSLTLTLFVSCSHLFYDNVFISYEYYPNKHYKFSNGKYILHSAENNTNPIKKILTNKTEIEVYNSYELYNEKKKKILLPPIEGKLTAKELKSINDLTKKYNYLAILYNESKNTLNSSTSSHTFRLYNLKTQVLEFELQSIVEEDNSSNNVNLMMENINYLSYKKIAHKLKKHLK